MDETEVRGYRRPQHKKWNPAGVLAVCFSVAVILTYGVLAVILLKKLLDRSMTYAEVRMLLNGALVAAILSGVALIAAVVGLFLKRRKKAGAVTGLILSILLLAVSLLILGAYEYTVGALQTNHEFNDLSKEELSVVETEPDGRVNRETEPTESTLSSSEIEEQAGYAEVHRQLLVNEDIPEDALAAMHSADPVGESYLLEGADQIQNIVLYGLDEIGSSDCVIILSIDHVHHKVKLISISRDSYVQIPQWGSYSRITYAYSWGGAEMALSTLNTNFSLNITDYITVELEQLAVIIDQIGGVEVDLDYNEIAWLGYAPNLAYGKCLLTGEQAVGYTRLRSTSSDDNEFKRTGRQREVLTAMMEKLLSMPYSEYPELIRLCMGLCETSLASEELMEICMQVALGGYSFDEQYLIPGDMIEYWGGFIGEYTYCVYDLNRASDKIYRLIYENLYVSGYMD